MRRLLRQFLVLVLTIVLITMTGCVERFFGTGTDYYTGDPISPADIDSIFNAISVATTDRYSVETDGDGDLLVYWLEGGSVWHVSSSCSSVAKSDRDDIRSGKIFDAVKDGKDRACKICSGNYEDYTYITELSELPAERTNASIHSDTTELFNAETTISLQYETTSIGSDTTILEVRDETTSASHDQMPETTIKYPKDYDSSGTLIVYWLKNGSVWHESVQCGTVQKASKDNVYFGSPYDAYSAGKQRACKICSADSDVVIGSLETSLEAAATETTAVVEKYPKQYDANGELIVYWLDGGSVWHVSLYCSVLSDVSPDRILSGSVSEAILSFKERACKKCSQYSQ